MITPAFPAQWFTAYRRSSVNQCSFATVASHDALGIVANLPPASGRQDHATSPSADDAGRQSAHPRPLHSAPRFVTIAIRPSHRRGMGEGKHDFRKNERELFLRRGLERGKYLDAICKIRFVGRGLCVPARVFVCRQGRSGEIETGLPDRANRLVRRSDIAECRGEAYVESSPGMLSRSYWIAPYAKADIARRVKCPRCPGAIVPALQRTCAKRTNSHAAAGGFSELASWLPNLLASSATTFSWD